VVGAAAAALMGLLAATAAAPLASAPAPVAASIPNRPTSADPASLVHPLDGTGTGPVRPGTVGEFPGADLPFGAIQWSPDTSPDAVQSGGGYAYGDDRINGFSLTHLSGTGCPSYQDVPMLPTVGTVPAAPAATTATFSHGDEQARPGRYRVDLGTGPTRVAVTLAVTERSGIASLGFPAATDANVLFKVADSANPPSASSVRVVGRDVVEGQVTSGGFCGTGTNYTLHFVAQFDRPFTVAGTWDASGTTPGRATCADTSCGAYVTFDTMSARTVLMKVGISFVSLANAAQNLRAEDPGWSVDHVAATAQAAWNTLLGRVAVSGGTPAEEHTFYTALYHSLLFPNVVSDDNGQYAGSDGKVHTASGHDEYANFSEWDIYRSEVQLESLLAPRAVGGMVQSLVDDAEQGGWLPKWAIVGGDEAQMNGDSADPVIADAYAMGVRNFDVGAALRAMVKGATQNETNHGLQIERQYLSQYLSQHYVNAASPDLTSIDYSIGGSATLEYALDDFAIARIAAAQHHPALAATMSARAATWEYLFDPATGYLGARGPDGSFSPGSAFQASQLEPGGQTGFEEGNAVQYTWAVPEDPAAEASLMGGDAAAAAKLETFFTQLNATRNAPYDWSGNEPGEWAPWLFDYFGAPDQTQRVVRAIADTEYADAAVDEPGNDDLGAISSWYVWAALGLFPVTPGAADLALASPLFPTASIQLPDGHRLVLHAPGAAASRPYVHALTVSGVTRPAADSGVCGASSRSAAVASPNAWNMPWLPGSVLRSGGSLDFTLSASPDPSWASSPNSGPPSFGTGNLPAVGYTSPGGALTAPASRSTTVQLGVVASAPHATSVVWNVASDTSGLQVTPSSGTLALHPPSGDPTACRPAPPATQSLTVSGTTVGTHALRIDLRTTEGSVLPPVVLDVTVQP
jgi:predicted alpha-1,2-mannosidase